MGDLYQFTDTRQPLDGKSNLDYRNLTEGIQYVTLMNTRGNIDIAR